MADKYTSKYTGADIDEAVGLANTAYQLPTTGIPLNDLTPSVRVSLAKADTALQSVPNATTTTRGIVLLGASGGAATYAATNAKYTKPSNGIPLSDLASTVQTSIGLADTAYQLPSDGIPASHLSSEVQDSLAKIRGAIIGIGDGGGYEWQGEEPPYYCHITHDLGVDYPQVRLIAVEENPDYSIVTGQELGATVTFPVGNEVYIYVNFPLVCIAIIGMG